MTPVEFLLILCIVAIAAGPEDIVIPAVAGILAVLVGTLLYGTPTIDLFGLTVFGVITFAARTVLRVLTGYGALIRWPVRNRQRNDSETTDPVEPPFEHHDE